MKRAVVENYLAIFDPEAYLPRLASNTREVYVNSFVLRELPCTDYVVSYLAGIMLDAINKKVRFRKFECLKIIRYIIKYDTHSSILSPETVDKLFSLYQYFIFSPREEIQWCVSVFLKGRLLRDWQIQWLIENWSKSNHITNRLLRYPSPNPLVHEWAYKVLMSGELRNRASEVAALLIDDTIPEVAKNESREVLLWAIYYARAKIDVKEKLLLQVVDNSCLDTAVKIALRLPSHVLLCRIRDIAS